MWGLDHSRADLIGTVSHRVDDRRRIAGEQGLPNVVGRILRRRDQLAHVDE
ncbi:Uncharacterised protein [Mycobacterium tuberculosis]|nr:Uncharacterised protein [Mycobacterium tuberculosis]